MSHEPVRIATERQRAASDPTASAWVSANAGSGKTRVLAERVVRFLLDGTAPERILCLTFTKAAAAEMESRIFAMLGGWVLLDDETLSERLHAVSGRARFAPEFLARARRLFAEALETPGGLKIQTIHAFCESLLHRFPLEADVPPGFEVLDDQRRGELMGELRGAVLFDAAQNDGALASALRQVVAHVQAADFDAILNEILGKRAELRAAFERFGDAEGIMAALCEVHGLEAGATPASIAAEVAGDTFDRAEFEAVEAQLGTGSANDVKAAGRIRHLLDAATERTRLDALFDVFLTKTDRTPIAKPVTKGVQERHPDLLAWFEAWQETAAFALQRYRAASTCVATAALLRLAETIVRRYEDEKRTRGLLDYDGLIAKSVDLLEGTDAAWVLYRLDGGLDHILVDEAQDTSPEQWRVIGHLSEEFFVGVGARDDVVRTVFAVGDDKQSIFSFQGADPKEFEAMRRHFKAQADNAQALFDTVPLTVSFRSVPVILRAVDLVFSGKAGEGLTLSDIPPHVASRTGQPGRVEIWPTVKPEEVDDVVRWDAPLDLDGQQSPRRRLARKIADTIAGWFAPPSEELGALKRPIEPGDILILVRRRDAFVDAMVSELKRREIPVAGADRLLLGSHIAVMDLISLSRFVLLEEDDLALAEVLKSPLVTKADGTPVDDDDLLTIAYDRPGNLWHALTRAARADPQLAPVVELLRSWRGLAGWQRPFEFYSAVLGGSAGRHTPSGRKRFVERLGTEAHDPLDEFLGQALQYERDGAPSLEGFVQWITSSDTQIRRDMEHGKNEVRIMTVHGAKGLEAGVVFLPDTCTVPEGRMDPKVMALNVEDRTGAPVALPCWRMGAAFETQPIADARAGWRTRVMEENNRLLYVAMTRAKDRLYVCGYDGKRARPAGCWYDLITRALKPACREVPDENGETMLLRMEDEDANQLGGDDAMADLRYAPQEPPDWAHGPPAEEPPAAAFLAPSKLEFDASEGGAVRQSDDQPVLSPLQGSDEQRFRRGRLIHTLLQLLPDIPAQERLARGRGYLSQPGHALEVTAREEILSAALSVLDDPAIAWLFGSGSRSEVPLAAHLPVRDTEGREIVISGQIDRIAVRDDAVMIVDYKTNRPAPVSLESVPDVYLRQMAAYRLALRSIYPGRDVKAGLLWTDGPRFMEIPDNLLSAALPL